jgi:transcriptional regulator with XRE-family HTH domain
MKTAPEKELTTAVAAIARAARTKAKLTQLQLAGRLGLRDIQAVQKVEYAHVHMDIARFACWMEACGLDPVTALRSVLDMRAANRLPKEEADPADVVA